MGWIRVRGPWVYLQIYSIHFYLLNLCCFSRSCFYSFTIMLTVPNLYLKSWVTTWVPHFAIQASTEHMHSSPADSFNHVNWGSLPCLPDFGSPPLSSVLINGTTAAKLLQSCPTLCDPIDGSPPGSPIPGILQTRTLEWAAISFSSAWKWKVKVKPLSRIQLLATPWTAAYRAPPSIGFSTSTQLFKPETWNYLRPFLLPDFQHLSGTQIYFPLTNSDWFLHFYFY